MNTIKMKLTFEVPADTDPYDILEQICDQVSMGEERGTIREGRQELDWDLSERYASVNIDQRQRLAAALLLMGFDLPQEMTMFSASMLEAAEICPGIKMGQIPIETKGRRIALEKARELIDQMLGEMEQA